MAMTSDMGKSFEKDVFNPLIISTPGYGEAGTAVPFRNALYFVAYLQSVWIGVGALYFDPFVQNPGFFLKAYIYIPFICLVFGAAILVAMTLQTLLADYFGQFNYSEKFAFFLIHWVFFYLPSMLLRRFNISLSVLSMEFFILLCLVLPVHFQRLYAVNIFLLTCVMIRFPQAPVFWIIGGFLLISTSLCLDYFYFKLYSYGETRSPRVWELFKVGARYIIPPLIFAALAFMLLPPLTPKTAFGGGFSLKTPPRDAVSQPQVFSRLILEGTLVAILLMVAIALLNWLQKKLRGKKPPPMTPVKGVIRRIQRFIEQKIIQPHKEKALSPRERAILEYNRFCEDMANVGFARESFQTPQEYSQALHPKTDDKDVLQKITNTFENIMYGNRDIDDSAERDFTKSLKTLLSDFKERYSS